MEIYYVQPMRSLDIDKEIVMLQQSILNTKRPFLKHKKDIDVFIEKANEEELIVFGKKNKFIILTCSVVPEGTKYPEETVNQWNTDFDVVYPTGIQILKAECKS